MKYDTDYFKNKFPNSANIWTYNRYNITLADSDDADKNINGFVVHPMPTASDYLIYESLDTVGFKMWPKNHLYLEDPDHKYSWHRHYSPTDRGLVVKNHGKYIILATDHVFSSEKHAVFEDYCSRHDHISETVEKMFNKPNIALNDLKLDESVPTSLNIRCYVSRIIYSDEVYALGVRLLILDEKVNPLMRVVEGYIVIACNDEKYYCYQSGLAENA